MKARCRFTIDGEYKEFSFMTLPRVDEYVLIGPLRYRVCQVRHIPGELNPPELELQQEIR